jgi:DUF2993 family protein
MRRLLTIIVLLVVVEIVGDVMAKAWAEGQITTRARAELPASVHVDSHIHAFPFLVPIVLSGRVSDVGAHFENVPAGALVLSAVDLDLHGVRVDRNQLLKQRKVRLVSVREGTVSADITAKVLGRALHVPVTIAGGQVKATIAGVTVAANVQVRGNALVFAVPGLANLAIPRTRLLPCTSAVTVLAGRLRVSCTIHDVPPGLLGAANERLG